MPSRLVCTPRTPPSQRRALTAALSTATGSRSPDDASGSSARGLIDARKRESEDGSGPHPAVIAVVKRSSWGPKGARLTTAFLDNPSAELRRELLRHLNMWSARANVEFVYTTTDAQVRIARLTDPDWAGYWSYVGKDILGIPANEPTMNLEAFTMRTPLSEFRRVVCHEAGHTLGFPHEHMRQELVGRIDPQKAYPYFSRTDGWSKADVDQQVLTPLRDATIFSTPPDQTSIMCYQLPGEIMRDGKPILGGTRINESDHAFAALIYPKPAQDVSTAPRKAAKQRVKTSKASAPAKVAKAAKTAKKAAKRSVKSARKRA